MTTRSPDLRLLICGMADRGDDGAPLAAIAQILPVIRDELRVRLEVRRCPSFAATDIIAVGEGQACLIVDTVVGVEPGRVVTISLEALADRPGGITLRSSHELAIRDELLLVELVRGSLPPGALVGIGGKWFGYGERFSRAVRCGLPAFADAIRSAVEEQLAVAI
jgi:Ni,Fe-hydrogenase maturation factor